MHETSDGLTKGALGSASKNNTFLLMPDSRMEGSLPITHIHSFLVQERKGLEERAIGGASLPLEGKLFGLLRDVYKRSVSECDVDICFRPTDDGAQRNICRDLIIAHVKRPNLATARPLAQRLELATDRRSGLGLLFLIVGRENNSKRIILSRFPTDEAILAEETEVALSVQFLERVFLKNKFSYKAAMYEDTDIVGGMWEGVAVDKQNGDHSTPYSNYWIGDFLASDLSVTPAYGTRRLGVALKEAANKVADLGVKREIIAAATLATGLRDKRISVAAFEDRFNLSEEARNAINSEIKTSKALNERFKFDEGVFNSIVGYRSVHLDTGCVLTAASKDFDEIIAQEQLPNRRGTRFTTVGNIVGERLKKTL